MPRDENSMPLDKFFKEKESEYEDGRDREHDRELDEMMWELGDYQSEEPLGEMKEFEEESPAEEMLTEKEMLRSGKRVYLKEPEGVDTRIPVGRRLVGVKSLRIGLESSDCEIVCGYNSVADRKKLEARCRNRGISISDFWYEREAMASVMGGKWIEWYYAHELLHERRVCASDVNSLPIGLYLDDEFQGIISFG